MQCSTVRASGFANDDAGDICVFGQEERKPFLQTCSTEVEEMLSGPKMMMSCNTGACQPLCIVSRL
jgi:hypothetical protein